MPQAEPAGPAKRASRAGPVEPAPSTLGPGPRTKVRRLAERAVYERETIYSILDEGIVCHLGYCAGGGPFVIPTAYARDGDILYLHGAPANAALAGAASGNFVCLAVTLVDGLVLARSAFHHSINYRSVVIFGPAEEVADPEEKRRALALFVEHIVPGRGHEARPPSDGELRATRVIRVQIAEASAKVRTGGPKDEPEDLDLPGIWAGELPLRVVPQMPVPDFHGLVTAEVPAHVSLYRARQPGSS